MLALALLACAVPEDGSPADDTSAIADDGCVHPMWEGAWPFPSNALVTRDATSPTGVRLTIDPAHVPLTKNGVASLDTAHLQALDGFSRVAPVVVQLDTAVDPTAFGAASDATAPIGILDVEAGTFVAGRLSVTDDGTTLAVWPDGALRPGALHAIVLREDLPTGSCFSAGPAVLAAESAGDELAGEMAAARAALDAAGITGVAAVVPFTTRSVQSESVTMDSMAAQVPDLVSPSDLALTFVDCAVESDSYCAEGVGFVGRGTATLPTWQGATGTFVVDADGVPTAQGTEDLDVWLLVPELAREEDVPLMIIQHGLGGEKEHMVGLGQGFVRQGYAVVAIDAVAHGDRPRDGDTTMAFFGIDFTQWQVARARDNVRQTAADHTALRTLLVEAADAGFAGFALDARDAVYLGQSLGGIIGASTCATDIGLDRCVLNVPGGRLIEVVRGNAAYAALLNIYFDRSEQAADIELFSAMAQLVVDPGDPSVVGPRILSTAPARPVLVQEAIYDETVVNPTTEVMARSMGLPLLTPSLEEISGLAPEAMPVADNVAGADAMVTAGLAQFDDGHDFLTAGGEEGARGLRQIQAFLATGQIDAGVTGE